jgi:hypothetical protein
VESEGLALLEVYVNEEQISESPLFVRVEKPVCRTAAGDDDPTRVADENVGDCVCLSGCVFVSTTFVSVFVSLSLFLCLFLSLSLSLSLRPAVGDAPTGRKTLSPKP